MKNNGNLAVLDSEPAAGAKRLRAEAVQGRLSPWAQSPVRRLFDTALVIAMMPVLLPIFLVVAAAVGLGSHGPILFLQHRVGRDGTLFTILKFRTMTFPNERRTVITTIDDPAITRIGRLLRRWKLDELPQFFNVLRGDMSLVGPRPKVPEQQIEPVPCRPGITGAATLAFAHEELYLAAIERSRLETYYRDVLLPLKNHLDAAYMAQATLLTDLRLLQRTAFLLRFRPNGEMDQATHSIQSFIHRGSEAPVAD